MKQSQTSYQKTTAVLACLLCTVVVLMPFHAFFTTWIGANTGSLLLVRAWKEALFLPAVGIGIFLLIKDKALRRKFFGEALPWLILIYALWQIFAAGLHSRDADSLLLGLTIQLRIFVVFLLARIVAYYRPPSRALLQKIIMIPAIGVIVVGLLQMFLVPYDFLKHFGYQKNVTIPPFFTIDDQVGKLRIASTLRGPNPLGVYLLLPLLIAIQQLKQSIAGRLSRKIMTSSILLVATVIVLYGSHSRGAWLGAAAAGLCWAVVTLPRRWKMMLVVAVIPFGLVSGLLISQYRNTTFVQDVLLHDNPVEGGDISSNTGHLDSLKAGIQDIKSSPLTGCGPGCAGPASVYNKNGAKIAENYFIQTAQETGLIGLIILLMIFGVIGLRLVQSSADPMHSVLLATFVGINVASLLAHAWSDDTIAYLWWSLAGIVMYTKVDNQKVTNGTQKTNKRT